MLTEQQSTLIEQALIEDVEPRKLAAYLCLHMGLSSSEAAGLRLGDVDLGERLLTVRRSLIRADEQDHGVEGFVVAPVDQERILPIPSHVYELLKANLRLYQDADCYIISGSPEQPKPHYLQNILHSVNVKYKIAGKLTVNMLRDVFIRRCFECGIDLYTVGEILGLKQLTALERRFAGYLPYHPEQMEALAKYTQGYEPPILPADGPKRMNLLILGAGSQGPVVKEVAQALGVFNEIAFLDDDPGNKLAMDSCENYRKYLHQYPIVLPSFGNCQLRAKWLELLEEAGFILPTLIHPMATISPSAIIGEGTIVEMKAIVNTGARIKPGCIISSGAVVDVNATVERNCHIGSAATIKKGVVVPPFSVLQSGTVFG